MKISKLKIDLFYAFFLVSFLSLTRFCISSETLWQRWQNWNIFSPIQIISIFNMLEMSRNSQLDLAQLTINFNIQADWIELELKFSWAQLLLWIFSSCSNYSWLMAYLFERSNSPDSPSIDTVYIQYTQYNTVFKMW